MISLQHGPSGVPSRPSVANLRIAVAGGVAALALGGAIAVVAIGGDASDTGDRAARGADATVPLSFDDPAVIKGARGGAFHDPAVIKGARGAPLN